mgnify:CR=1 FL=1
MAMSDVQLQPNTPDRSEDPIVVRLRERLDGQIRLPEFEMLLLDSVQTCYGTVGRGYLETRLLMAATFEDAIGSVDEIEPPLGHV